MSNSQSRQSKSSKMISVALDVSLYNKLLKYAQKKYITVSDLVRISIIEKLDSMKSKEDNVL